MEKIQALRQSGLARRLFLATRPMFFPASAVPVAVGTAWGVAGGQAFAPGLFALALAGMFALHAGANVLNDVSDELNGCDRANDDRIGPFTGGSRFLQDDILSLPAMAVWGCSLLTLAALAGVGLIAAKGVTVLVLGVIGAALALAYSLRPVALASRGLGELAVAIAFGLPVGACAWLQAGELSASATLAAVAVAAWTAAILVANEVPDRKADAWAGKRTLVVRLGLAATRRLYLGIHAAGAAAVAALVPVAGLPAWALVPAFALLAAAADAARHLTERRDDQLRAIRATLALHLAGGVWLTVAAISGR